MGNFTDGNSAPYGYTSAIRYTYLLEFLATKKRKAMFVTVSTYYARNGEEDAVIALHEDWQRNQRFKVQGNLSGELLRSVEDPHAFIAILRFESQEAAQALANDPEQAAWHQRLASLTERISIPSEYKSEWQAY